MSSGDWHIYFQHKNSIAKRAWNIQRLTLAAKNALIDSFEPNQSFATMKTYLGVSKIAKITGKPRATILRWIQSGKFGGVSRVGNEYQITHEQFLAWWKHNMNSTN